MAPCSPDSKHVHLESCSKVMGVCYAMSKVSISNVACCIIRCLLIIVENTIRLWYIGTSSWVNMGIKGLKKVLSKPWTSSYPVLRIYAGSSVGLEQRPRYFVIGPWRNWFEFPMCATRLIPYDVSQTHMDKFRSLHSIISMYINALQAQYRCVVMCCTMRGCVQVGLVV